MVKTKAVTKANKNIGALGIAYIYSGYNNTIVTLTDLEGNTIAWNSSGKAGFKGSKKSTPYAATVVGESVAKESYNYGLREIIVLLKGVGSGKAQAVKALRNGGLIINRIVDITPIPHGGIRPKKRRRV